MLVGTRPVVLHTTMRSLAVGPETQQVLGVSALALSLLTPGGCCHVFLAFASYCVRPLWCSLLHLPVPGWRAEWQEECASKPWVLSLFPLGKLSKQADAGFPPSPSVIGAPTWPDAWSAEPDEPAAVPVHCSVCWRQGLAFWKWTRSLLPSASSGVSHANTPLGARSGGIFLSGSCGTFRVVSHHLHTVCVPLTPALATVRGELCQGPPPHQICFCMRWACRCPGFVVLAGCLLPSSGNMFWE